MLSAGGLGIDPYSLPGSEHHNMAVRIQPHYSLIRRAFVQLGRVVLHTRLEEQFGSASEGFHMAGNSSYGCGSFLLDLTLSVLPGGLWLIWIFVREMRRR